MSEELLLLVLRLLEVRKRMLELALELNAPFVKAAEALEKLEKRRAAQEAAKR